jgi:hypothetical protein
MSLLVPLPNEDDRARVVGARRGSAQGPILSGSLEVRFA